MIKFLTPRRGCNACRLGPCQCHLVTNRDWGVIPGCIPPTKQLTLLEINNIAQITNAGDLYADACQRYLNGKLEYDNFHRVLANIGVIRPVA